MPSSVIKLDEPELFQAMRDARLVSLRWEIIPWCLVFDIDAPMSEAEFAPMRRAWIVFHGLSELSFPIENARLPNGCWFTSPISCIALDDGFHQYEMSALIPHFIGNKPDGNPSKNVVVRSKGILGVVSSTGAVPTQSTLTWQERIALATDEEMHSAVGSL